MHRLLLGLLFLLLLVPSTAYGEESFAYAAIEVNPLSAALAHQYGGQLHARIAGPLSVVGSASYLFLQGDRPDTRDDGLVSLPQLRGWMFELGPRFQIPSPGRHGSFMWIGAALTLDVLTEGSISQLENYSGVSREAERNVQRYGLALDGGVTFPLGDGFFLTTGLGLVTRFDNKGLRSEGNGVVDVHPQRGNWSPRVLLSLGWGF